MGDMLSKTSHKKKDPAIDQEFLKNVSEVLEKARKMQKLLEEQMSDEE